MKKFLWILCATFPVTVLAQTANTNSLFPELQQIKEQQDQTLEDADSLGGESTDEETAEEAQALSASSFPNASFAPQNTQSRLGGGSLLLLPDELQIVTPPARGFAFCTGKLTLENQTGDDLKSLSLRLKFGGVEIPVNYGSIPDKGSQTKNIGSAGQSCQSFSSVPAITVVACSLGKTTDPAECRSKLRYSPIN